MMSSDEFLDWCDRLQLSANSVSLIQSIRSQKLLRVEASRALGHFPSAKMGHCVRFESQLQAQKVEDYEKEEEVLEFYVDSNVIYLDYLTDTNRRVRHPYTPDFFILRTTSVGWEDWKSEEELLKLAKRSPNRWQRTGKVWRHVPGEAYARNFNLSYSLQVSGKQPKESCHGANPY